MKVIIRNVVIFSILFSLGCEKRKQFELPIDWEKKLQKTMDCQIKTEVNRLNIIIDPRIELLAIVQFLIEKKSNQMFINNLDFEYKKDVLSHFQPFKKHPVIEELSSMSRSGFNYDTPPKALLHVSEPPNLEILFNFEDYIKRKAGGKQNLDNFFRLLRDFAAKTDFINFYNAHKETYTKIVKKESTDVKDNNYIETLENFYGEKRNSYNVILVPLYSGHGFGIYIKRNDSLEDIYAVCGFTQLEEGIPSLGGELAYRHLTFHEFSHAFVDLFSGGYQQQINKYSSLYTPISGIMQKQAYGSWWSCVEEHLVRVITTRLVYHDQTNDYINSALSSQKHHGFFYVEVLNDRIAMYEKNRDKYLKFKDFYPEIVKTFKELAESNLGDDYYKTSFNGSVNTLFMDGGPIAFILPTNEQNKSLQHEIYSDIKELIKDIPVFKEMQLIPDSIALKKDLTSYWIFAFGTPKGNRWISKFIHQIPIKIESDKLIADSLYIGKNLVFMTTWFHPQNEQKGVQILTGQNLESIWNIMCQREKFNSQIKDVSINYAIANKLTVLNTGIYKKENKQWTFQSQ